MSLTSKQAIDKHDSPNRPPAWASDPRWARAREHAMREEVLQAEMLLRGLVAEHGDCTPGRVAVAEYMVGRGDFDGALQWLQSPQADGSDGQVSLAVARLHFARRGPAAARVA